MVVGITHVLCTYPTESYTDLSVSINFAPAKLINKTSKNNIRGQDIVN